MRASVGSRLAALESARGDDIEIIVQLPGEGPPLVLVNGKPAPTGFKLPDVCEFELWRDGVKLGTTPS